MNRSRAWRIAATLAWLVGCSCEREAPVLHAHEHESESESESESEHHQGDHACTLDPASHVIGHESAVHAVAIAASEHGRPVVLAEHDGTHLDAFLLAAEDVAPVPVSIEIADASALFAFEATAPTHFVALTLGSCTADERASSCVHAVSLDTSLGRVITRGLRTVLLPAPLRSSRVMAASDSLYFAHAHQGAAPVLDRFSTAGTDLAVVSTPLGQGDPTLVTEPSEILGIAASGGGYAILWRRGATDDARSAVLVTTQLDEHQVAALHDALVVESMAWLAGSLSIIVSLEFARPSYVRLGADGEMRGPAMTLRFGEEPPAPFGGRRVALVRGEPGALRLQVRDGSGDDVGPMIALDASAQRADTARSEDGFYVVTTDGAEGDRALTVRHVLCP